MERVLLVNGSEAEAREIQREGKIVARAINLDEAWIVFSTSISADNTIPNIIAHFSDYEPLAKAFANFVTSNGSGLAR